MHDALLTIRLPPENFYNSLMRRYGWEAEADTIQELYLGGRQREFGATQTEPTLKQRQATRSAYFQIRAEFSPDVQAALSADPGLAAAIATRILDQHFPESLHQDILS